MLYDPKLHEPLTERLWDDAWVRDRIAALVADAGSAYDERTFWPAVEWDAWEASLPLTELYCGASGVLWALDELGSLAPSSLDLRAAAARVLERFREAPDSLLSLPLPAARRSSLFAGETGVAYVAWKLGVDDGLEDVLLSLVQANLGNETNELMWGVPGTLLVARAMHAATGEKRWADTIRMSEDDLRRSRDADGLWTQTLFGHVGRYLGPAHGFVANVAVLGDLDSAGDVLRRTAVRDGAHVNWPPTLEEGTTRLQWCHGAPGVIATAGAALDEELLLGGAQLIWDAGPLDAVEKGEGICHGTAGNGYGLLATFARTGDELWLERARAFAVHALEQADRSPRYSLLTGGIGAALYAADCLAAAPRVPVLDRF